MGPGDTFRRVGRASPLVPAMGYAAVVIVTNLAIGLAPKNLAVLGVGLLLWLLAGIAFFVIVTWYRDDDWLAAGFLLGLTLLLSGWAANLVATTVATRSIGGALFASPGLLLGLALWGVVVVPLCGGAVALARWVTRHVRARAARSATGAPPT